MKRELFSMYLLLSIATGLLAYDFKVGDLCYNITNDTLAPYSVEVTCENRSGWGEDSTTYSNLPSSVIIQESVIYNENSYNVTSIGYAAFRGTGLTSITIPNSVTSIGHSAFSRCTGLTSITIPNNVTNIGDLAFYSCTGLTSITIPNSVTNIGGAAFSGCTGLTSITIPNSVTWIGHDAFKDTPWLENQSGLIYIGNVLYAYKGEMPENTSIVVKDGVTSIVGSAFSGCTGLTSITIPNSVTSIGGGAFSGCTGLTSVTIPNSVTNIGSSAFSGCTGLTSITIPNSVTSIGYQAFYGCTGLTSVTIGNSVTSIGGQAFSGCTGLTSITIPNNVTSIERSAFSGCTGLTSITIPNSVTSIGVAAFSGCTGLTSITIPNNVTSIGGSAFSGCTGLTSITIPNSVTSIGSGTFRGCTSLTSVVWNAKHCADVYDGNSPFERTPVTSFVFGDSVQHIPSYLCLQMENLTSVTIGNSVTSIGWSAFGREYSQMHKFVCMSPDVEFFGEMPRFSYALDTIIAPARLLDVEESEWLTQPKYLKHAELTNGEMTDNVCRVLNRSYKTLLTLDLRGVSNTTIADEAFKGCYNLKTLRLPAQLTKVPYMAVADCKSLQEITIPATVEEIDNSAFENCRSIRSITFEGAVAPQGVAQYAPTTGCALWRIGNWAFYNCHELQNLLIPEGVTEIGDAAFYGCVYLQDMVLPGTIETIGDNAFALCSKLQKITVLSTTPPTIEAKTFYDVNRAIPVYVPAEAVADYKNDRYWKEFNIQADATAIEQTSASNITPRKIFRDGQVYILRGGKTYTLTGVEVNL